MNDNPKYGALPASAEKYQETKVFTQDTIPAGFKREHSTKAGVWGKIIVVSGALELTIYEPEATQLVLDEGEFAIAAPRQTHSVRLSDGAAFKVEFYTVALS